MFNLGIDVRFMDNPMKLKRLVSLRQPILARWLFSLGFYYGVLHKSVLYKFKCNYFAKAWYN